MVVSERRILNHVLDNKPLITQGICVVFYCNHVDF